MGDYFSVIVKLRVVSFPALPPPRNKTFFRDRSVLGPGCPVSPGRSNLGLCRSFQAQGMLSGASITELSVLIVCRPNIFMICSFVYGPL